VTLVEVCRHGNSRTKRTIGIENVGTDELTLLMLGYFAGTLGIRRLLKMFDKYNIKATWFIPGHSLECVFDIRRLSDRFTN